MRVSFETYTMVYKGNDEEGLPMFERKDVRHVEGTVVDTVVLSTPNFVSNTKTQEPYFVIALDDLTFAHVPVKECTRVDNIYLDDKL